MATERKKQFDRAELAEGENKPLQDKVAAYEGRTWAGRKLRQVGRGIVAVAAIYGGIRFMAH